MKFSVAICTWNRADLLERTLKSLAGMHIPTHVEWEVIIVENRCTDGTVEVCKRWSQRLPLKTFSETNQGHCHARNRAIRNCHGDVILWTDDDIEVSTEWLERYQMAVAANPSASFWGGPIRPKFTGEVPQWVQENWATLQGCFASRDLGKEPVPLSAERLPYGANFAVRTDVQKQFPFDVQLGRRGTLVNGDDELEMLQRVLRAGYQGYWVPDAPVDHLIAADRATLKYIYRYFVGQGRAISRKDAAHAAPTPSLRREALIQKLLFGIKYPIASSPNWMAHWIRAALAQGRYEGQKELVRAG
jgi:glycosyltransferase involved in cell wall biosynthesis